MTSWKAARGHVSLAAALLWVVPVAVAQPGPEAVRTLIHVLDYVAADYAGAVSGGAIVDELEYREMVQFAAIADSLAIGLRGAGVPGGEGDLSGAIGLLASDIARLAPAEEVAARARAARDLVITASGIAVAPARWPDVVRGAEGFARNCTTCHGAAGHGDGPAAPALDPPPANLAEGDRIAGIAPFQVFNTVRLGVAGTGMTGFPQLTEQEAWEIAFFVKTLRTAGGGGTRSPETLRALVTLEELSSLGDPELEALVGRRGAERPAEVVRELRRLPPPRFGASTLDVAERRLAETLEAFGSGRVSEARTLAVSAYLEGVEPVEPMIRAVAPDLVRDLETAMMAVRSAVGAGAGVEAAVTDARRLVVEAGEVLAGGGTASAWLTFGLALSILLREALEAFLVIITILGLIRVSGQSGAARWVHAGWIAAVLVGVGGWFLAEALIRTSAASREVLEGTIALVAVAVLLSVGWWLHDRSSSRKWTAFIDRRVRRELGRGSLVGLASFSFFVVFREAFESVLFLSAIGLDGGRHAGMAIGAATLVTLVTVLVAGMLVVRFSARLPVRQLFRVASWVVAVLAVVLAGKGVHALQEAGYLPVSLAGILPRIELLGLYPTVESIVAQGAVIGTVALLWTLSARPGLLRPSAPGTPP